MTTRVKKYEDINKKTKKTIKEAKSQKRKKCVRKVLLVIFIIIALLITYARFIEPNIIRVKEYKIETPKITENNNGLKIVHFSDLHYESTITHNNIEKVINKINFLNPDVVVFTGDLIEEKISLTDSEVKYLISELTKIKTKLGKYAVLGNHDIDNSYAKDVLEKSGFKILANEEELIYNKDNTPIALYGVKDTLYEDASIKDFNLDNNYLKILLVHEPDYIKQTNNSFDIVLAGHSHNGQVKIPFLKPLWLPIGSRSYWDNYYKVGETDLYISNGLGSSGINLRFASTPSINLYRIVKR